MSSALRFLAVASLLVLGALPVSAQTVLYPGLEGQPLLDAIQADYSPTGTLGYGPARDELYGWEQNRNGNLRAVYSGFTIVLSGDPSNSALAQGVNTEHTWPQSLGMGDEPQRSDMHNLYPVREEINSARGNSPLLDIPDAETDTWFRLDQQQSSIPTTNLDEWSEVDDDNPPSGYFGVFEPREDHKGNAARALFYVYAIWESELTSGFIDIQLDNLLAWHVQDPVDTFEADRSTFIASEQGNQNPFILDSTLARRAFDPDDGGGGPGGEAADLLITEYVEGSSFNKAIEIFNGTDEAVNLAGYTLEVYFNGNSFAGTTINLSGTIAPGDVFVLAENSADPAILAEADQTTNDFLWNGNDAIVLARGSDVIDTIGQIGFDPGDEWGSGFTSTKDNTLRRLAGDCTADTDPNDAFDPATHYLGFANNSFDDLGSTSLVCETTPVVTADIEPVGAPIVIAASGGSLSYTVTLTNTTAMTQVITAEINATLPNGNPFGPIQGPQTLPVAANSSIGPVTFTENVPGVAPAGTYTVTLTLTSGGEEIDADSFTFDKVAAVASRANPDFALSSVYPNPMRDAATVAFALPEADAVRLVVYDVLGREVAVLADGVLDAGEHEVRFDGADLPSGVYVVRLNAGGQVQTQRVTVVR